MQCVPSRYILIFSEINLKILPQYINKPSGLLYGKVMSRDIPIYNILAICREVLNRKNWEVLHLGKCFISRDALF